MTLRYNLMAIGALALVTLLFFLSGCTATKEAYAAVENPRETAFVITEHYAALIHEGADLSEDPNTPEAVKSAIKVAANESAKYIIGDPTAQPPLPSLLDYVKSFEELGTAESSEALTKAIANATHALNGLVQAVQKARRAAATEKVPAAMLAVY